MVDIKVLEVISRSRSRSQREDLVDSITEKLIKLKRVAINYMIYHHFDF